MHFEMMSKGWRKHGPALSQEGGGHTIQPRGAVAVSGGRGKNPVVRSQEKPVIMFTNTYQKLDGPGQMEVLTTDDCYVRTYVLIIQSEPLPFFDGNVRPSRAS